MTTSEQIKKPPSALVAWVRNFKAEYGRRPREPDMPPEIGLLFNDWELQKRQGQDTARQEPALYRTHTAEDCNAFVRGTPTPKKKGRKLKALHGSENDHFGTDTGLQYIQQGGTGSREVLQPLITPTKTLRMSHIRAGVQFTASLSGSAFQTALCKGSRLETASISGGAAGKAATDNAQEMGRQHETFVAHSNKHLQQTEAAMTQAFNSQTSQKLEPSTEGPIEDAENQPTTSRKRAGNPAERAAQKRQKENKGSGASDSLDTSRSNGHSMKSDTSSSSSETEDEGDDTPASQPGRQRALRAKPFQEPAKPVKARQGGGKARANYVRSDRKGGGRGAFSFKSRTGSQRRKGKSRFRTERALGQAGDGADYIEGFDAAKRKGVCYKCRRAGHWANECPTASRGAEEEEAGDTSSREHCRDGAQENCQPVQIASKDSSPPAVQLPDEIVAAITAARDGGYDGLPKILQGVFGHQHFRGLQLDVIKRTLEGKSTLAILPTGAGKSLCYQLPALIREGLTLVISPLIALMRDQLHHLPPELPAGMLWGTQSRDEALQTLADLKAGKLRLLFVAPERLHNTLLLEALAPLLPLPLVVIDEAHCVAEWGHNFRSAYFRLGLMLREKVACQAVLALTATATRATQTSICSVLDIPTDDVLLDSVLPQNLRLTVAKSTQGTQESVKSELLSILSQASKGATTIIYTTFQAQADALARFLRSNGIKAASYHSGKLDKEREKVQQDFGQGRLKVVVATLAFGMGLDAAHVRSVIHMSMPRSLEEYVQQVGRAGRSGQEAHCRLFLSDADFQRLRSLAHSDGIDGSHVLAILHHVFRGSPGEGLGAQGPHYGIIDPKKVCQELDIKEEVIETLLSYIEVSEQYLLKMLPPSASSVKIYFYKLRPEDLAGEFDIIKALLHLTNGRMGCYSASMAALCNRLLQPPAKILQALQELAKLQHIRFELLQTQSLAFEVLQAPENMAELAESLAARHGHGGRMQVLRLDDAYRTFATACGVAGSSEQEKLLRQAIAEYFEAGMADAHAEDLASLPLAAADQMIGVDARALSLELRKKFGGEAQHISGRTIAKVLHGLNSVACPAKQWSSSSFWGRYTNVAFSHVLKIAERNCSLQRGQR